MSNVKRVRVTGEDAAQETLSSLEELNETINEPEDEEIDKLFSAFEPMKVSEVIKVDTSIEVTPVIDWKSCWAGTWYYAKKGMPLKVPIKMRDQLLRAKPPKIKDIW